MTGRKAESEIQIGRDYPEQFASVLCMQDASFPRPEKSFILTGVQGNFAFPLAAKQMRRLLGPCVGAARRDVPVSADMDASSEEEADYGARVAHRKMKRKCGKKGMGHVDGRKSENKAKDEWSQSTHRRS